MGIFIYGGNSGGGSGSGSGSSSSNETIYNIINGNMVKSGLGALYNDSSFDLDIDIGEYYIQGSLININSYTTLLPPDMDTYIIVDKDGDYTQVDQNVGDPEPTIDETTSMIIWKFTTDYNGVINAEDRRFFSVRPKQDLSVFNEEKSIVVKFMQDSGSDYPTGTLHFETDSFTRINDDFVTYDSSSGKYYIQKSGVYRILMRYEAGTTNTYFGLQMMHSLNEYYSTIYLMNDDYTSDVTDYLHKYIIFPFRAEKGDYFYLNLYNFNIYINSMHPFIFHLQYLGEETDNSLAGLQ